MLQEFLEKEELNKFQILYYLERSTYLSLSRETFINYLQISSFVFNRLIDEIIIDIQRFNLLESLNVIYSGKEIFLETDGTIGADFFLESYVKESICYRMLKSAFLQNCKSLNEFSIEESISYPIAHRSLKKLNKLLSKFCIQINKKFTLQSEEEYELRLFLLEIFVKIEKNEYLFYKNKDSYFIKYQIEKIKLNKISDFEEIRLIHYLNIIEVRIHTGCLQKRMPFANQKIENKELFTFFTRFRLDKVNEIKEVDALAFFYFSHFWLTQAQTNVLIEERSKEALSFLTQLKKEFPLVSQYPEKITNVKQEIEQVYIYLMGVSRYHDEFIPTIDLNYFKENYPKVFQVCSIYIKKLNHKQSVLYSNKNYLLLNYLLIVINNFPVEVLLEPILLNVSFSQGDYYNHFIKQKIESLRKSYSLQYVSIEEAEIILTNNRDIGKKAAKDYIIWPSFPRPVDWENLKRLIKETRKENVNH